MVAAVARRVECECIHRDLICPTDSGSASPILGSKECFLRPRYPAVWSKKVIGDSEPDPTTEKLRVTLHGRRFVRTMRSETVCGSQYMVAKRFEHRDKHSK